MDRIAHLMTTKNDELYNYTYYLPFETQFTPVRTTTWMQDYWWQSVTLSFFYVLSIYFGRKYMEKRKPYELENVLTFWNACLALFSILGALRVSPEFFYVLHTHGLRYSICTAGNALAYVTGFWTEMFAYSKAIELIDTLFIILRKRRLIFLHWYHHITVLIYTWHAYKDHCATGRWFVWMNYNVHAFMYTYYVARSYGWRFTKWIPMTITCMQLSQMIVGCYITGYAYHTKLTGNFCQQTYENLYFAFGIYFTYLILFVQFFYDAYLKKGNRYQEYQKKFRQDQNENIETTSANTDGKKIQ